MTRRYLTNAALGLAFVAHLAPFVFPLENSYKVLLHATRESLHLPQESAKMRTQLMTTESGQQFECLLPPLSPDDKGKEDATINTSALLIAKEEKGQRAAFMSFGRAAAKKVKPTCVQYEDTQSYWVYEICPGVSIRRISHQMSASLLDRFVSPVEAQVDAASDTLFGKENVAEENAEELGNYVKDLSHVVLTYDHYTMPGMQARLTHLEKPLYTQTFGKDQHIQVQFICSTSSANDNVSAVQWKNHEGEGHPREIVAFLVGSRMFCHPRYSDVDKNDLHTVRSLLQPLVDARTCVTRNEGWWTYEFCFGRSLRQFHMNSDGQVTAEYSLGTFDRAGNSDLERLGSALVSAHIDATHDVSRPAYLELYDHGMVCKEGESRAPRKAKVFYYCSQGGTSNHIIAVKEIQTCSYTVKVSSPVLCDHPHFLNDEQTRDQDATMLNCIPVAEAASTATE